MSKYKYTYLVEFYTVNGIIKRKYIDAREKQEALEIANAKDKIIQIVTCHRVDTF